MPGDDDDIKSRRRHHGIGNRRKRHPDMNIAILESNTDDYASYDDGNGGALISSFVEVLNAIEPKGKMRMDDMMCYIAKCIRRRRQKTGSTEILNSHMMGFQRIVYFCGFQWDFSEMVPTLILREWDVVDENKKVTEQPIFKNRRNNSIILDYFFRYHFYRNDGVLITVEEPRAVQSKEDEVDYSDIKLTFKKCTYSLRSNDDVDEMNTIEMKKFADRSVDTDAFNARDHQIYQYLKDLKLVGFNKKRGGGDEQQEEKHVDVGDDDVGYDSNFDDDYKSKLNKWGFAKYAIKFEEEGFKDPNHWGEITEKELKGAIGMTAVHLMKWKTKMAAWQKKLDLKAEREAAKAKDVGGQ